MTTFFVGQRLDPGMFPIIEDIYRIDTKVEQRWFVVQTRPQAETKATERIAECGFAIYSPARVFWGKRDKRTNKMPRRVARLMPGYLFVKMPIKGAFDRLRECDGVHQIVCSQGSPAAIPDIWVDSFRDREARGEFDTTRRRQKVRNDKSPYPDWIFPGAIIKIKDGPFASLLGSVIEAVQAGRVKVESRLFDRPTTIDLDLAQIAKP